MLFNIPDNISQSCGIYTITNNYDNRFYIGSTLCFKRRYSDHKNRLKKKKHANPYLQSFVNKYGIETLSFNLLFICNKECLVFNEKHWIETLKPQLNVKKIINRPISDDEMRYNNSLLLIRMKNVKSPLQNIDLRLENCIKLTEEEIKLLPF